MQQNKVVPTVFRRFFSSNCVEFYFGILQVHFLKCYKTNCQVKCDSVEK